MKLRLKILLMLLPLTIVPLVAMGWIAYSELQSVSERKGLRGNGLLCQSNFKQQAETRLATATANIELFAKHTMVREVYSHRATKVSAIHCCKTRCCGLSQDSRTPFPKYYEIRIMLPDGYEDMRLTNREIEDTTDEEDGNPVFQAMRERRRQHNND